MNHPGKSPVARTALPFLFSLFLCTTLHAQTMTLSSYYGALGATYGTAVATDSSGNAYVVSSTSSDLRCKGGDPGGIQNVTVAQIKSDMSPGWCSYLGGKDTDSGYGITLDASGNIYVVGMTNSPGLGTAGVYQSQLMGADDAFVAELNPTGSLLWFTYLGTANESQANSVYVDSAGGIYITGYTTGNGWPVAGSVGQTKYGGGGFDIVMAKLNPGGSSLAWSGYLGGSADDVGYRLAVSPDGSQACLDGYTQSSNYPTTPGAYQTMKNAARAAVVTCLNASTGATNASTYFGGSSTSQAQCNTCAAGLAFDASGDLWIVGLTQRETGFPITSDAWQPNYAGGLHDAFISELTTDLSTSSLLYSTYFGGSGDDGAVAPEFDADGNLWIHGNTFSDNLPVTGNAFQSMNGGPPMTSDSFLLELSPTNVNTSPWTVNYSTYLGGSENEFGGATQSLAIGPGAVWFTGWTYSTNLPLVKAFDTTLKASPSGFVAALTVP